jgi:hypothetical protein
MRGEACVKHKVAAWILSVSALAFAPAASQAQERYDPQEAGHPLRIIAYAAHPVGWLLDRLIFFPAWWIGGHEPLRSIVGHAGLPDERLVPVSPERSDIEAAPREPVESESSEPVEPESSEPPAEND